MVSIRDASCGPYTIVFFNDADNSPVDSAIFDVNAFSFKVRYTEDSSVVKDYNMRYRIFFTNYPTGPVLESAPFNIKIADPCLTVTLAFNGSVPYISRTYFLQDPSIELYKSPEKFITMQTFLTISFSCGPYEIAFFNNADSSLVETSIFDVNSFRFKVKYTEDRSLEGEYNIGYKVFLQKYPAIPALKSTAPFTITIKDPCKTTVLGFINPVPYASKTYFLYDPFFEFHKQPDEFISKDTSFDCGPYEIAFFNIDNTPVNTVIFDVNSFSFKIRYTNDHSLEGQYIIAYKVSLKNYPAHAPLTSTAPFTITIADPCKTTRLDFI